MVRVGRRDVLIFTFLSDSPGVYDRWENVSLVLIRIVVAAGSIGGLKGESIEHQK